MVAFFPDARPTDKSDRRIGWLAVNLAKCATTQNAATHFAAQEDWDLLAVYYDAIDHAGHSFMEYHPPAMAHVSAEDAAIYGNVVNSIIASTTFCSAGYLTWSDPIPPSSFCRTTVFIIIIFDRRCANIREPLKRLGESNFVASTSGDLRSDRTWHQARRIVLWDESPRYCTDYPCAAKVFRFRMIWMVGFSPEFLPNRWSWSVLLPTNHPTKTMVSPKCLGGGN